MIRMSSDEISSLAAVSTLRTFLHMKNDWVVAGGGGGKRQQSGNSLTGEKQRKKKRLLLHYQAMRLGHEMKADTK